MKKVLITGVNGYIGKSFEQWVLQYKNKYTVEKISLRDERWKGSSFKGYDAVLHTAAIVHVKEDEVENYFKINKELTIEVAKKAKQEGVKQFIFLSTMGVYGTETGFITEDTLPTPKTDYAKSKYEAEQVLKQIEAPDFNVAILRPPIVYGKDCPGNYSRLASLAIKLPFFPAIDNERSMIYIDNLSEFIRLIVDENVSGIYFPQNKEYVNTTQLVKYVAESHKKKIKMSKLLNWTVRLGLKHSETLRKVFGSFVYDKKLPGGHGTFLGGKSINYQTNSFEESVKKTEM
ncbi:NAD-dependent epimerase/dehydratase family protein [Lysinibacillus yapensis]|uniref:NAD-dependent epimerase/dehydratase family protein n=1 Tax=Ureibacillus yapensis TaxID=2304605 RepID=A0A396SEL9_9BACL|nr:NAD-dependent epimerase/dehydratase family protein [Lysinibacillus yapensis]RHW39562.1 NAD-dependent epimerase/dehydratase family protein [Lysinibacillus yapensis]